MFVYIILVVLLGILWLSEIFFGGKQNRFWFIVYKYFTICKNLMLSSVYIYWCSVDLVLMLCRRRYDVDSMLIPANVETTSIQHLYDANVDTTLFLRIWYVNFVNLMMSVSIWRQHSVDYMLVDVSMHHIRCTFIILYLRR